MVVDSSKKIIDQLSDSANQGLSFELAKEKLKSKGFTDEQISKATDNYEYGLKKPEPDTSPVAQKYLETHPKEAKKDANNIADAIKKEVEKDDHTVAELQSLAGLTGPKVNNFSAEAPSTYSQKLSGELGKSFIGLVVLILAADIIGFFAITWLNLPPITYLVNVAVFVALVYVLVRKLIK